MTQDILQYLHVYADKELTREITANDIFDLRNQDNELEFYITANDCLSINDQGQLCIALDGQYKVIFFDIVKNIEGEWFRDFSMVEEIKTEFVFNTKPLIENFINKIGSQPIHKTLFMLDYFSFKKIALKKTIFKYDDTNNKLIFRTEDMVGDREIWKLLDSELKLGYKSEDVIKQNQWYNISPYYRKTYVAADNSETNPIELNRLYHYEMPSNNITLFEKIFNTDLIEVIIQSKELNNILQSAVLYYDGLLGKTHLNILADIKPTFYIMQDYFKNFQPTFSAEYVLALGKYEILARWNSYCSYDTEEYEYNGPDKVAYSTYNMLTAIIGLGVVDTVSRYNSLYSDIKGTGVVVSDEKEQGLLTIYNLYQDNKNTLKLTPGRIINSVTHKDGKVALNNRVKEVVGQGYVGSEANMFLSYETFCKKYKIDLDYITSYDNQAIGAKSYSLYKALYSNTNFNPKIFCEFYDRYHPAPLNNIYSYIPIPITVANYDKKGLYRVSDKIKNSLKNNNVFYVTKLKRTEDEEGNEKIEEVGTFEYPVGTFMIPFNKDEYIKTISIPGAIHTFLSKDAVVKVKIKFKKNPNRKQNLAIRLFADDYLFGRKFYIQRLR